MRRAIGVLFMFVASHSHLATAQYFQYSQYNFTEQRINPAMTARTRYASATLDSRNQKTGGDFSIRSNFVELSFPFLNSSTGQPWSGIGISFHDDRSGGIFETQEAALSYAVHIYGSQLKSLSFGMKVLYASRTINYDGFYTGSQFVPDRGFNGAASNGESLYRTNNSFATFSAGMFWEQRDLKGRTINHLGLSLFDMNRPEDSFLNNTSHLASTFMVDVGFQAFSNGTVHVLPEALVTYAASLATMNAGLRVQKEFNVDPKKPSDRLDLLAKYAIGRSGILGMQFHRENFSVGLSYDFPVAANAANLGAVEVGVTIRRLVPTHAQTLAARRKKAADERKFLAEKKAQERAKKNKPIVIAKKAEVEPEVAIKPVVIDTLASSTIKADASAGQLKQDPLLVEKITLHFSFDFNSTDLDEETQVFLDDLIKTLAENQGLRVQIVGHTDNIGSEKFNLRLSQKRASTISQYLMKHGIAHERIHSEGRGLTEPLNDNSNDNERALNRRVVITLSY
jgi:type IX secretion system PorP/SprF family membrane protein